ncbi:MAG: hypothetical protein CAK89_08045 [Opitutia bacterium AMD-G3]|jgi:hypothetical protein|nr:MAG: hypothetical protein CAK89_08045 [Opitutae bacterium AMD-G3]
MRNPLPIPTKEDWVGHIPLVDGKPAYQDFDLEAAYRNFYGKTHAEAFALFTEPVLNYYDDLFWMPARCLEFYLPDYIRYLDSDLSRGDSDAANYLFSIVDIRHEEIRAGDPEVRDGVIRTLRRVGQTQEWYDAAPDIYGCFATRSEACLALLGAA